MLHSSDGEEGREKSPEKHGEENFTEGGRTLKYSKQRETSDSRDCPSTVRKFPFRLGKERSGHRGLILKEERGGLIW